MRSFQSQFSIVALVSCLTLSGCFIDDPYPSEGLKSYFADQMLVSLGKGDQFKAGQARFLFDDFGSLNGKSLTDGNIIPIKIYFTALLLADPALSRYPLKEKDIPRTMEKYGFIQPKSIANWRTDLAPLPRLPSITGFIKGTLDFDVPLLAQGQVGVKHFKLEVGNITCAACHSGVTYDAQGLPKKAVWLGAANTSLNIDGFFDQIYQGLKIGFADETQFMRRIKQVYPGLSNDRLEEKTIRSLFPTIAKELKKYAPMNRVFSFPNGGPGLTNGVGAFKRDAALVDKYKFNPHEAGIVSIPDIGQRKFRSSFTYDGAYGVPGLKRYSVVDSKQASKSSHIDSMANLAAFFTYSAMGNNIKNIEPHMPRVREVFQHFIKDLEAPKFPSVINTQLATRGEAIFSKMCSSCHGTYSAGITNPKLVSFPNRFVPQDRIGTDPYRWQGIDEATQKFTKTTIFAKYVDAGMKLGGYVAPILSGLWYTAPYLHNGSVPTLWQLMTPNERPAKFQLGGHALDYTQVGIAGFKTAQNEWLFHPGYQPWMIPGIYDTTKPGQSNQGHEKPFTSLASEDKWALIEYLKLL